MMYYSSRQKTSDKLKYYRLSCIWREHWNWCQSTRKYSCEDMTIFNIFSSTYSLTNHFPFFPLRSCMHGRILSYTNKYTISLLIDGIACCLYEKQKLTLILQFKFTLYFLYHVKKNVFNNHPRKGNPLQENMKQYIFVFFCGNRNYKFTRLGHIGLFP